MIESIHILASVLTIWSQSVILDEHGQFDMPRTDEQVIEEYENNLEMNTRRQEILDDAINRAIEINNRYEIKVWSSE